MAWRDSRRNRSRLLLFVSSIILGIAALVATFSFGYNLQNDIDKQAKTLVGADLVIQGNKPPTPQLQTILDSIGNERSQERSFASMVYFVKDSGTRLVQVRALDGSYPFYGELETTPASAGPHFRKGRNALVDKTLMLQFNASIGDSIQVGDIKFAITGTLNKAPGRNTISTTVAPPVYIPLQFLDSTGLVQKGSRIAYNYYYKFNNEADVDAVVRELESKLDQESMDYDTVEERKEIPAGRLKISPNSSRSSVLLRCCWAA